ncbi:MAG: presenilin family intramembrane aspartyl protease PSH [Salinigranum sp.]
MSARTYRGVALAALIFLLVQLGALALVPTFYAKGYQTVENPSNPVNSVLYIGAILVMTAFMLAAFRFDLDWLVRAVIIFTSGLLAWYVFAAVVPPELAVGTGLVGINLVPLALAAAVAVALYVYPEWYVIDVAGVVMGAGAAGLFGISFGLLPAIVLLTVLAVYDAISVYGTEHMLSLAKGVMNLRIPVVLVIPLSLSYSLLESDPAAEVDIDDDSGADGPSADGSDPSAADEPEAPPASASDGTAPSASGDATPVEAEVPAANGRGEGAAEAANERGDLPEASSTDADENELPPERDVFFIGLGDAVMPTVMIASGAFFSPAASLGVSWLPALNLPALGAMVGTFLGLGVLLWAVMKGRPHAGLPLLNGGAIGGYLVGSLLAGVSLLTALGL